MTETRTCKYEPCSKPFVPTHPRQVFCEPTCRSNQWYVDNPGNGRELVDGALRSVATHPLDDVRGQHEESKGHWTAIVREHLNRTLLQTGYVSAKDFDALGIPDEHHNLANAQMGGYASAGYMEAITWEHSKKASRKSGKIWTYKLTQKGREKLSSTAGSSADASSGVVESVSAGSGDAPASPEQGNGSPGTAAVAPPAPGEPDARLPGFEESDAARRMRDAA